MSIRENRVGLGNGGISLAYLPMQTRMSMILCCLHSMVESGLIGEPRLVMADFCKVVSKTDNRNWMWDPKLGGGALLHIGEYFGGVVQQQTLRHFSLSTIATVSVTLITMYVAGLYPVTFALLIFGQLSKPKVYAHGDTYNGR